jgi:hypothetical protein
LCGAIELLSVGVLFWTAMIGVVVFTGAAYGENVGWITFDTGDNRVLTTWSATDIYTLTYDTRPNLVLFGSTSQQVADGSNGTAVEVVPSDGYRFVEWSDGNTTNPRTDTTITGTLTVYPVVEKQSSGSSGTSARTQVKKATAFGNEDQAKKVEEQFLDGTNPNEPQTLEDTLEAVQGMSADLHNNFNPATDKDTVKKLIEVLLELIEALTKLMLQTEVAG